MRTESARRDRRVMRIKRYLTVHDELIIKPCIRRNNECFMEQRICSARDSFKRNGIVPMLKITVHRHRSGRTIKDKMQQCILFDNRRKAFGREVWFNNPLPLFCGGLFQPLYHRLECLGGEKCKKYRKQYYPFHINMIFPEYHS